MIGGVEYVSVYEQLSHDGAGTAHGQLSGVLAHPVSQSWYAASLQGQLLLEVAQVPPQPQSADAVRLTLPNKQMAAITVVIYFLSIFILSLLSALFFL